MTYGMTADFYCISDFIFDDFRISTCRDTAIANAVCFIIGILFQYIIYKEREFYIKYEENLYKTNRETKEKLIEKVILILLRLIIITISTFVMFTVMTYNLYYILTMIMSYSIGNLIFSKVSQRKVEVNSCCFMS